MIVFPNCKINLGLNIIRKRSDGYHELETIFYPLRLQDALEVVVQDDAKRSAADYTFGNLVVTGEVIRCNPEANLCVQAYSILKSRCPSMPRVSMHLHKTIPAGSGLGGGSSDGSFALQLLNQKLSLGLTLEQLLDCALQLGSDCPFFIVNKPCLGSGRGEFLERVDVDLSGYKIIIVSPGIHISTTEAFSLARPKAPPKSIKEIIQQPIETWAMNLKNDFEESVFEKYPTIKKIKEELYNAGGIYASMTGSGSAVYGIFEKHDVVKLPFPSNYFIKELISKPQQLP